MALDLGRISLRERERGLLIGGTGTGKSWLAEALVVDFRRRYAHKGARVLILDSKPRFRAQYEASGRPAKRRYKSWDHGPTVPGSVVVTSADELTLAFGTGCAVAIAQTADPNDDDPKLLTDIASEFFRQSRGGRPQLLVVDETMDFYRTNTAAIGSNALLKAARAGRERGLGALYCSQRTKGIPSQLLEELTKCYLFCLDYVDDAKRLQEMGAPAELRPPEQDRQFYYWTKAARRNVYGPYQLTLPTKRPA